MKKAVEKLRKSQMTREERKSLENINNTNDNIDNNNNNNDNNIKKIKKNKELPVIKLHQTSELANKVIIDNDNNIEVVYNDNTINNTSNNQLITTNNPIDNNTINNTINNILCSNNMTINDLISLIINNNKDSIDSVFINNQFNNNQIWNIRKFKNYEELENKINSYFINYDIDLFNIVNNKKSITRIYTKLDLCDYLDIINDTLVDLRNSYINNVRLLIKKADTKIEKFAVSMLIAQKGNVAGLIFYLKNHFNYVDKQEIASVSVNLYKDFNTLTEEQMRQEIERLDLELYPKGFRNQAKKFDI